MAKGTAFIDVPAHDLCCAVLRFPQAYKVVGSMACPEAGVVRLVVESDFIEGHGQQFTWVVRESGSTRKVMMLPM